MVWWTRGINRGDGKRMGPAQRQTGLWTPLLKHLPFSPLRSGSEALICNSHYAPLQQDGTPVVGRVHKNVLFCKAWNTVMVLKKINHYLPKDIQKGLKKVTLHLAVLVGQQSKLRGVGSVGFPSWPLLLPFTLLEILHVHIYDTLALSIPFLRAK